MFHLASRCYKMKLAVRVSVGLSALLVLCVRGGAPLMPHMSRTYEEQPGAWPAWQTAHSPMRELAAEPYSNIDGCLCRETPNLYMECYSETCRRFPASLRITTNLFKIVQTNIQAIGRDDLLLFSNVTFMEIEYNLKLVRLEPGCFRHMANLISVTILCNPALRYLDENVFEGLVSLKILDIRRNGFKCIKDVTRALSVAHVPQLQLLEVQEMPLRVIEKDAFSPMYNSSLEQLNLIGCSIIYIDPECLAPLRKLNFLRLGRNFFNISSLSNLLERSISLGLSFYAMNLYDVGFRDQYLYDLLKIVARSRMPYLYLAENRLEQVDDHSLPEMPYLEGLDLRSNLITRISDQAFRTLPRLETLLLSCNKLDGVPRGTMVPTLVELDFAENNRVSEEAAFFNIDDGVFENMTRLEILTLSGNNISFLTKRSFVGLRRLLELRLRECSLYFIEPGTFLPLHNLSYLNLKRNILLPTFLTADTLVGLANLQKLELNGCALTNLTASPNLFVHTPRLTYLGLDENGLYVIAPDQLVHLHSLQELHLAGNELTSWQEPILSHTSALVTFDGRQNKFDSITKAMLTDWHHVENLYLDGGILVCDCSLRDMSAWLAQRGGVANLSGTCMEAGGWRDRELRAFLQNTTYFTIDCQLWRHSQLLVVAAALLAALVALACMCYWLRWHLGYWRFLLRMRLLRGRKQRQAAHPHRYDAFVSYCSADRDFVLRLVAMLEGHEQPLKLCIFERDFPVGSDIAAEILQSVLVSKHTLLVISDAFARSQWCRWETQLAEYHELFFSEDDTLVMLKIGAVSKANTTPTLRYLMKTRIYLEWDAEPRKQAVFWTKLHHTLVSSKQDSQPASA